MISKKITAFALVAILGVTSIGSGFATATPIVATPVAPTSLLKVESAYDLAVKNSLSNQLTVLENAKRKTDLEDAEFKLRTLNTVSDDEVYAATDAITSIKDAQDISNETTALNNAILKDTLSQLYVSIYKAEVSLKTLNTQVAFDDIQIVYDRARKNKGQISQTALETKYNGYLNTKKTRDTKANELEKLRITLKEYTHLDSTTVSKLEYNWIKAYAFTKPNYDNGLKQMQTDNLTFKNLNKSLARVQYTLDLLKKRYPESKSSISSTTKIENAMDDVAKAKLDIENAVSSATYLYSNTYDSVLDAMDDYNQKKSDYAVAKTAFAIAQKQYKLGQLSKQAFQSSEVTFKSASGELDSAWADYVSAQLNLKAVINGTKTK